jgi:hypothetical protein
LRVVAQRERHLSRHLPPRSQPRRQAEQV